MIEVLETPARDVLPCDEHGLKMAQSTIPFGRMCPLAQDRIGEVTLEIFSSLNDQIPEVGHLLDVHHFVDRTVELGDSQVRHPLDRCAGGPFDAILEPVAPAINLFLIPPLAPKFQTADRGEEPP